MKKHLFVVASTALGLFVGCNKSPIAPQDSSSTYCILATTESSSVADIIRMPDKDTYTRGDTVMLIAKPRLGYAFSGWSGDTTATKDTIKIIIKKNTTIYADFINISSGKKVYTVNTLAQNGSIALSPSGGIYDSGAIIAAAAQPIYGYTFSGWEGALSGTNASTTLTVKNNITLTANFAADPDAVFATLHISPTPTKGTITLLPLGAQTANGYKYKPGTEVTVTATADNTYEFSAWTGDVTQSSSSINSTSITMNRDRTISATFSKAPEGVKWTKRTSGTGNGLIYPIWDGKQFEDMDNAKFLDDIFFAVSGMDRHAIRCRWWLYSGFGNELRLPVDLAGCCHLDQSSHWIGNLVLPGMERKENGRRGIRFRLYHGER